MKINHFFKDIISYLTSLIHDTNVFFIKICLSQSLFVAHNWYLIFLPIIGTTFILPIIGTKLKHIFTLCKPPWFHISDCGLELRRKLTRVKEINFYKLPISEMSLSNYGCYFMVPIVGNFFMLPIMGWPINGTFYTSLFRENFKSNPHPPSIEAHFLHQTKNLFIIGGDIRLTRYWYFVPRTGRKDVL